MGTRTEGSTGTRVPVSPPSDFTGAVLTDIVLERHRQVQLWGHNEDTPDGTGPNAKWLAGLHDQVNLDKVGATTLEAVLRDAYDEHVKNGGQLTWLHFLLEEVAEAFKEDDPVKLYTELVQVAAVAVSWCEKIRQR